ncbi:MAG: hypothetical protein J6U70_04195 [Bacteroidales bacterium]|nr:hypothetical protein [Bacteroidales bacterium]
MLKKFFTGLMAAGMLLTTSCQEQEFTPALGEATVTFEVTTPEIATRAYSDGTTANKLQYAVYHMNDTQYGTISHKTTDAEIHGTTTLSLQLTAGETYQIILWADAEGAPYTVNFEDKTMIVDYTNVVSNNESLDAFYAVHKFTVTGAQTETVELRRPFAQLNIGTNDYGKAEAASGYVPTQSSVTVKGIYNTLNLANGTVSGAADVTFGSADIDKAEKFPVTGYEYVAMNYVLVGADKSLVDVEFTISDNNNNNKTRTVSSVPVQRNYRTNIYGSILTSDVDVNVEINPDYTTPDNVVYVVKNYDELKAAVINGGYIEFANDITVDKWIMFSEDYDIADGNIITIDKINVTIDGKGHTLTVNAIESAGNGNQLFQGASNLNISNLTLKYADGLTTGGLELESGVIENVHFVGGGAHAASAAIFPRNGEIKVKDCIFDTNGVAFYFDNESDNLTVTGCTFNMNENKNVILLRGDVKFTDNIVNTGRTVNVVSGSPVVTRNNFKNVRFKVYGAATATISDNIINNLEFDGPTYASTFSNNTLSVEAQAALDAATKVN